MGLGAQDCYYETAGAYTAAVSTSMLKSVGSQYVLAGHSERRATFGDRCATRPMIWLVVRGAWWRLS